MFNNELSAKAIWKKIYVMRERGIFLFFLKINSNKKFLRGNIEATFLICFCAIKTSPTECEIKKYCSVNAIVKKWIYITPD